MGWRENVKVLPRGTGDVRGEEGAAFFSFQWKFLGYFLPLLALYQHAKFSNITYSRKDGEKQWW
jgi:hypothetical protein|nr:MAG TPA: hypothetical protein [Caudoviricetes sp.]